MSPKSVGQFLAVVLIWGTTWIVIKDQLDVVNPSWSVTYRFALAGVLLMGWCRWRGIPLALPLPALLFASLLGLFQFVLNFNFVYRSELHVPSGIPAVAFALLMIPNAILAWAFLGRRISPRFAIGSAIGIAGVAMLFWQQLAFPGDRSDTLRGLLLVGAGVLSASVANVMQASPRAIAIPPLATLAWAMLIGASVNALVALAIAGPPAWDPRPQYFLGVIYLGLFASAVAFALYFDLVRTIGPAEAAWTGVLIPMLAMAISTLLEGYRWTPLGMAGSMLALIGLVVALRAPPARKIAAQT